MYRSYEMDYRLETVDSDLLIRELQRFDLKKMIEVIIKPSYVYFIFQEESNEPNIKYYIRVQVRGPFFFNEYFDYAVKTLSNIMTEAGFQDFHEKLYQINLNHAKDYRYSFTK